MWQLRVQRLDVELERGDGVGETHGNGRVLAQGRGLGLREPVAQQPGELCTGGTLQHDQAGGDLVQHLHRLVDIAQLAALEVGIELRLELGEIDQHLAQQRGDALAQILRMRRVEDQLAGGSEMLLAALKAQRAEQRTFKTRLDTEQGSGDAHPLPLGLGLLAAAEAGEFTGLVEQHLFELRQAEQRQRAGDALQTLAHAVLRLGAQRTGAQGEIETVLDGGEIGTHLGGDLLEQTGVGAAQLGTGFLQSALDGQAAVELQRSAQRRPAAAAGIDRGGMREQPPGDLGRTRHHGDLALLGQQLQLLAHAAEPALELQRFGTRHRQQRIGRGGEGAPQQRDLRRRGVAGDVVAHLAQLEQGVAGLHALEPLQDQRLERRQQLAGDHLRRAGRAARAVREQRAHGGELHLLHEEIGLGDGWATGGEPELAEHRLQHRGAVWYVAQQRVEVVGELQRRAADDGERGERLGELAVGDGAHGGAELLGQQQAAVAAGEIERTAHEAQFFLDAAGLQSVAIGLLLHLDQRADAAERDVDLRQQPLEHVGQQQAAASLGRLNSQHGRTPRRRSGGAG